MGLPRLASRPAFRSRKAVAKCQRHIVPISQPKLKCYRLHTSLVAAHISTAAAVASSMALGRKAIGVALGRVSRCLLNGLNGDDGGLVLRVACCRDNVSVYNYIEDCVETFLLRRALPCGGHGAGSSRAGGGRRWGPTENVEWVLQDKQRVSFSIPMPSKKIEYQLPKFGARDASSMRLAGQTQNAIPRSGSWMAWMIAGPQLNAERGI